MANRSLEIVRKRIKNINLKVKPDGVVVSAPFWVSDRTIYEFIQSKEAWINKNLDLFKLRALKSLDKIKHGSTVEFLGEKYTLHLVSALDDDVTLEINGVNIYTTDRNNIDYNQELLNQWYFRQAKECFSRLINKYLNTVNRPVHHVSIRQMRSRWGSCNPKKGYINLNLELIKQPIVAIEYVVLHELTHLLYYHHDDKFYHHISQYMPDWKLRSKLLRM